MHRLFLLHNVYYYHVEYKNIFFIHLSILEMASNKVDYTVVQKKCPRFCPNIELKNKDTTVFLEYVSPRTRNFGLNL